MRSDDSYDALGEETVKRISTERSLPHDNVIVEGRFLRTWGVDIRSMLISPGEIERAGRREEKKLNKPRGDERAGRREEKKLNKPRGDRESGAQRAKEAD